MVAPKETLRCCASCEWIFKALKEQPECPKCGFGSYTARYVHGKKCYRYAKTQTPWLEKKLFSYEMKLRCEIEQYIARDNLVSLVQKICPKKK